MMIVLGAAGGAVAVGVTAMSVWNSRKLRAMRTVKRANHVLHNVGNALCRMSEVAEECM